MDTTNLASLSNAELHRINPEALSNDGVSALLRELFARGVEMFRYSLGPQGLRSIAHESSPNFPVSTPESQIVESSLAYPRMSLSFLPDMDSEWTVRTGNLKIFGALRREIALSGASSRRDCLFRPGERMCRSPSQLPLRG